MNTKISTAIRMQIMLRGARKVETELDRLFDAPIFLLHRRDFPIGVVVSLCRGQVVINCLDTRGPPHAVLPADEGEVLDLLVRVSLVDRMY